jgi:hypothetical protein
MEKCFQDGIDDIHLIFPCNQIFYIYLFRVTIAIKGPMLFGPHLDPKRNPGSPPAAPETAAALQDRKSQGHAGIPRQDPKNNLAIWEKLGKLYIYIDRSTSRPGYGFSKKKLNHVCFRAKG